MRLQHCAASAARLADTLAWRTTGAEPGEVLAVTLLHHSHDPSFRALPISMGLVRLDAGPIAICFLACGCGSGTRVTIAAKPDQAGRVVVSASPAADRLAALETEPC
jgi:hypothetical protein